MSHSDAAFVVSNKPLPSLWAATAPPGPDTPALVESVHTDVLVIGAGYTGLSTALHLAERGAQVTVVDAHEPGWGASGRNGGQVNPTVKHDPDELVRMLGPERADPLIEAVSSSADLVFGLVERHQIDCSPMRRGWLQVAYSPDAVTGMHARALQWQKRGVDVAMLDAAEVARHMGTRAFAGGWRDGRAGSVQPLAYARGLASAALAAGARIHGQSRVTALQRQGQRWLANTAQGVSVTAERVVIGTNGYTDALWPGLQQTLLAANSFIVATEPLGDAGLDILDDGTTASTSQRLLLYLRRDAEGRLLLGGRGNFADPRDPADFAHLERSLEMLYPQLKQIPRQYCWAGRVAITPDAMPHVHEPAPGVSIALGYNGRGVALATAMGQHLAQRLLEPAYRFPFPVSSVRPIPFHGLQRFYIAAGVLWYSLLDRISHR